VTTTVVQEPPSISSSDSEPCVAEVVSEVTSSTDEAKENRGNNCYDGEMSDSSSGGKLYEHENHQEIGTSSEKVDKRDVLLTRWGAEHQPGNHFLRNLIVDFQPKYQAIAPEHKSAKKAIIDEVLFLLKQTGGRFLNPAKPGMFRCATEDEAYKAVKRRLLRQKRTQKKMITPGRYDIPATAALPPIEEGAVPDSMLEGAPKRIDSAESTIEAAIQTLLSCIQ